MAKTLYFLSGAFSTYSRGNNNASLAGAATGWEPWGLSESRGAASSGFTALSVAGPTNGVEFKGNTFAEWLSEPLSADFTISGTITLNLWGFEGSMSDNAAINAVIEKVAAATGTLTQIAKSAFTTEMPTTPAIAHNFTVSPTSTALTRGDRIRIRVFIDDAGVMGAGAANCQFKCGGPTASADGDSWVQFTENLTFEASGDPSGSRYYLTDTAETINPGSATEKKALTTRGSGSVNAVTNTAAGFTSPIQITATAGGTAIEWYTPQLDAFTLGGKAKFNIRALESAAGANAGLRAEIAIVAADGTGATVWGIGNPMSSSASLGEITTSDVAYAAWVSGANTSVSAGQRLRFRVFLDDCADTAMASGFTATVTYSGASASAAGDTYVLLPQTVTEYVASSPARPHRQSNQVAIMRPALR